METITNEGKIYQLDESYLVRGKLVILRGHNREDGFVFMDGTEQGKFVYVIDEYSYLITTSKYTSGTIEDAPIELEDGEWYMCSFDNDDQDVFYYDADRLCLAGNLRDNTRPLYKMGKAES